MAEKTIGIRIQLNGLNTVITDIKTLEEEIRKAKEDLKQVEIGGPIFNQLAKEISQAETKLMGLQDTARGLSKEKTLEGFGKLGSGIASSFAAATAAVSLFGNESESVQKAATQAQNLLTVALSLRGIAEIKTGADIVARTIVEKASTAATNASNAATKALYTTLAANPYGAILLFVGLLVTAYLTLADATYDAEAAQDAYNKTLEDTLFQYEIERVNIQSNLELSLKKAELEGKSLKEINELKKQALQDTLVVIQNESDALEALRKQKQKEIRENIKDEKERQLAFKKLDEDIKKEGRRLGIEKFKTEQQILLDEIDLQIQLKNSVNKTTDAKKEYIQTILDEIAANSKLLVQNVQLNELDASIITNLEKKVEQAKNYANELNKLKTFSQLYKEELQELNPVQDKLGDIFITTKDLGEEFIDSLDAVSYSSEGAKEAISKFDNEIKKLSKGLSKSDQLLLQDFANGYKEIFETVQLISTFKESKGQPFDFNIEEFQQAVTDVNLLTGKITEDPYSKLKDVTKRRTAEQLSADKLTAKQRLETLKKSFTDEFVLYLEDQERKKGLTDQQIADNKKTNQDIAASTFDSLAGVGDTLLKFEQGVIKTSEKVIELNKKLQELAPAARAGFIIQNADEITKQYDILLPLVENEEEALSELQIEIAKKTFDEKKKYLVATQKLQADLLAQGIDIETLTYEQRLVLLEKFLNKSVGLTKEKKDVLTEEQKKFLNDSTRVVDEFASTIGRISSLVAQSFSFQLEALEDKNQEALSQVVGDTEEANKKRIELESQYQLQREQIEKKARLRALQFQKVQAITDVASASLRTFAELGFTPAAFVLAGIGATLAAIQVGLIQQQINAIQSMAGGGKIRIGAGGMVVGPSHEQGGVSFAAGGVNLEGGESVINKQSSLNYGGLLSQINQMGGGSPIVNNPSNSLMEERLIQAIAKSKNEPIRAYVMNSEITNGQAINRRLEELATL